jgi:hypothetical protein
MHMLCTGKKCLFARGGFVGMLHPSVGSPQGSNTAGRLHDTQGWGGRQCSKVLDQAYGRWGGPLHFGFHPTSLYVLSCGCSTGAALTSARRTGQKAPAGLSPHTDACDCSAALHHHSLRHFGPYGLIWRTMITALSSQGGQPWVAGAAESGGRTNGGSGAGCSMCGVIPCCPGLLKIPPTLPSKIM